MLDGGVWAGRIVDNETLTFYIRLALSEMDLCKPALMNSSENMRDALLEERSHE
jgi:hypothetical protein